MSSSVQEKLLTDEWLVTYLGGDGTLTGLLGSNKVYSEVIPIGEQLPAVRFHAQSQTDVNAADGTRALANLLYLVVVMVEGPTVGPAVPIANRLDELLHKDPKSNGRLTTAQSNLIPGISVLSSIRESGWDTFERTAEGQFRTVGGFYRLQVQPT